MVMLVRLKAGVLFILDHKKRFLNTQNLAQKEKEHKQL